MFGALPTIPLLINGPIEKGQPIDVISGWIKKWGLERSLRCTQEEGGVYNPGFNLILMNVKDGLSGPHSPSMDLKEIP